MATHDAQATPSDAYSRTPFSYDARSIRPLVLLFLAGLAAVVSPFLPWISLEDAFGTYHQNGFTLVGDQAWVPVAIGALIMAMVARNVFTRRREDFGEILGVMVLALVLWGITIHGFDLVGQQTLASAGVGLYLLLATSGALSLGGIWHAVIIGRGKPAVILNGAVVAVTLVVAVAIALVPAGSSTVSSVPTPSAATSTAMSSTAVSKP